MDGTKFKRVICGLSLVAGVGLCIGGIFVPILVAPGAALIGGGLGMMKGSVKCKEGQTNVPPNTPVESDVESSDYEGDVDTDSVATVRSEVYRHITWHYSSRGERWEVSNDGNRPRLES